MNFIICASIFTTANTKRCVTTRHHFYFVAVVKVFFRMSFREEEYVVPVSEPVVNVGRIKSKVLRANIPDYTVEFFGKVDKDGNFLCCDTFLTYRYTDLRLASAQEINAHLKKREEQEKKQEEKKRREEQTQQLESAIASMTYNELWQSKVFYLGLADLHNSHIKEMQFREEKKPDEL